MKELKRMQRRFVVMITSMILSIVALAQDTKSVDININKNEGNWYTQPWVWIVGAALFILLLVALLRGNSSRD
jgi:hypothetical protein